MKTFYAGSYSWQQKLGLSSLMLWGSILLCSLAAQTVRAAPSLLLCWRECQEGINKASRKSVTHSEEWWIFLYRYISCIVWPPILAVQIINFFFNPSNVKDICEFERLCGIDENVWVITFEFGSSYFNSFSSFELFSTVTGCEFSYK